ncbi:MAG: hypothetical protein RLZZ31_1724 [Actinomycetota bacterium]
MQLGKTSHQTQRRTFLAIVAAVLLVVLSGCSSNSSHGKNHDATNQLTRVQKDGASTVNAILSLNRPVVLAHAAGEDIAPHSTLYGFAQSVEYGVDVLDLDIQRTSDQFLVVQHDDTTKRTTEKDLKVNNVDYATLRSLDNGYWWSSTCRNTCTGKPESDYSFRGIRTGQKPPPEGYTAEDFAIPKFSEVAERWPGFVLNIEIKGTAPDAFTTARLLADEIARLGIEDRVVVTSFDDQVVNEFHRLSPKVRMSPGVNVLTAYVLQGAVIQPWLNILQVPPSYQGTAVFNQAFAQKAKQSGYYTWVWPNGEGETVAGYTDLFRQGADGVNASDPQAGVEALSNYLETR